MRQDEVTDVPLIYPMVSVTLKTCSIVNGRPVMSECEEIIDFRKTHRLMGCMARLGKNFREYVRMVLATTEQGHDALQNILDNHSRAASPTPVNPPSSPAPEAAADPGTAP